MEETAQIRYHPSYRLRPLESKKFRPSEVKKISEEVVANVLNGKSWSGEEESVWTSLITEEVKNRVKALNYPRYKIIVQVVLGQNKNQGVRVASRCLWDTDTDNYSSYQYESETLFCTVMVFGLYTE